MPQPRFTARPVVNDLLLAGTMWGNAAGCIAIASLTVMKRQRYGWRARLANGR